MTRTIRMHVVVLALLILLIVGLGARCLWDAYHKIMVDLAVAHTEVFEQVRETALQKPPEEEVGSLEYVVNYYPSGTVVPQGWPIARLQERARRDAIAAMIADLRQKTGQDFGDNPQPWIDHFKAKK